MTRGPSELLQRLIAASQPVPWASARTASRGQEYHEEGRVRRVRMEALRVSAEIYGSRPVPYQTEIYERDEELFSRCSCPGPQPCKHAVALLLAAQAAVRPSQLLVRPGSRLAERLAGRAQSGAFDTLPIDAAVDAFVSRHRASGGVLTSLDARQLDALIDRVRAQTGGPERTSELARSLLFGLGRFRTLVAPLGPSCDAQLAEMSALVSEGIVAGHLGAEDARTAVEILHTADARVVVALVAHLADAASRHAPARDVLRDATLKVLSGAYPPVWRPHVTVPGIDGIVDAIVRADVAAGAPQPAAELALKWPPGRTALGELVISLAALGIAAPILDLVQRVARQGGLGVFLLDAAWSAALSAGQTTAASAIARRAFASHPEQVWFERVRATVQPAEWRMLRSSLVSQAGGAELGVWVVDALAGEDDAPALLLQLALEPGGLGDVAERASARLETVDPDAAFHARSAQVMGLARTATGSLSVPELTTSLDHARRLAALAGDPDLYADLVEFLKREHAGSLAVTSAITHAGAGGARSAPRKKR